MGARYEICAIQFIKSEKSQYGEQLAAEKIGIEIIASGRGFTWTLKTYLKTNHGQKMVAIAKEKIESKGKRFNTSR
ncbi:MAG: hypothetical protein Ct9H300mP19_00130 [Dehalococcoidia bacterium]|nr:MAG: hypothetical protein Ct9H300mP19_00130 [Dehalococcoidia bacterium]